MVADRYPDWSRGRRRVRTVVDIQFWGETYRVPCPYSRDTRFRLWVNHQWGVRDGSGDNLNLIRCFNEDCLKKDRGRRQALFAGLFPRGPAPGTPTGAPTGVAAWSSAAAMAAADENPIPVVELPAGVRLDRLPSGHPARLYLEGRGFRPDDLARDYGVIYVDAARHSRPPIFEARIIIPLFAPARPGGVEARLAGGQARAVRDDLPKRCLKYLTSAGTPKGRLLYGLDRLAGTGTGTTAAVVVVEGITDAWRVGPGAVALFGKDLSAEQCRLLVRHARGRPVVVWLDPDAAANAAAARDQIARARAAAGDLAPAVVARTPAGRKDPAECSAVEVAGAVALALQGALPLPTAVAKTGGPNVTPGPAVPVLPDGTPVAVVRDAPALAALAEAGAAAPPGGLVVGLATTGPDPRAAGAAVVGVGLAVGGRAYYAPVGRPDGGGRAPAGQFPLPGLIDRLGLRGKPIVARDAKAVATWLRVHGGGEDPNTGGRGPGFQVEWDVAVGARLIELMDPQSPTPPPSRTPALGAADPEAVAADCLAVARHRDEQRRALRPFAFVADDVEMPLVEVVADMRDAGYAVDAARVREVIKEAGAEAARLRPRLAAEAGMGAAAFNPNDHAARLVYDRLRLPPPPYWNGSGLPPADGEALQPLAAQHPVVADLLRLRSAVSVVTNYGPNILKGIGPRGRFRADFNQLGTETGRFTAGVLHALPKADKDPFGLRRLFAAGPGLKLVTADYDQQELHVLALVSGDAALLEAVGAGTDLHGLAAARMFGLTRAPADVKGRHPAEREKAKAVQFAIVYGTTPYGLARQIGGDVDDARGLIDGYFKQFPAVKALIDRAHIDVFTNGYVDDVFGRRRRFSGVVDNVAAVQRAAQNFLVQGAAATVTKVAMVRCRRHLATNLPAARMLGQFHDELHFAVPAGRVDGFAAELEGLMGELGLERLGFTVPFRVSIKVGDNWGEMAPWQPARPAPKARPRQSRQ